MQINGKAQRIRVYIDESDQFRGKALYNAIVERCKAEGMAGATVLRGVEGYGASSRIHTTRLVDLSSDLPMVVEVIDKEERITRILPIIEEMVSGGLITLEEVQVVKYQQGRNSTK